MQVNLDKYTKEEIVEAFHKYMGYVAYEEGTTFVNRYGNDKGETWRHPNEELNDMSTTTVDIIHAIDEALYGANT